MKYDLHIHTKYSKCSNAEPRDILKCAYKQELDGIAVTDHNSIKGAVEIAKLNKRNKKNDFEVIVGSEIMTDKGEVLAYYIQENIAPGSFEEVVDAIRKQGGVCSISHPFTSGLFRKRLEVNYSILKKKVDAVEAFNARCMRQVENLKAEELAEKLNLAKTAGSDAHFAFEVGRASVVFEDSFRKAIKTRKINVYGTNSWAVFLRAASGFLKAARILEK